MATRERAPCACGHLCLRLRCRQGRQAPTTNLEGRCDGEAGHPSATTADRHGRTVDSMAENPAGSLEGDYSRDHL